MILWNAKGRATRPEKLRIHLNYDRILGVQGIQVKPLSGRADPGNANLPIGVFRRAIRANGVPGKIAD